MDDAVRYLLVVHYAPTSILRAVTHLRTRKEYANLGVLILTPNPEACAAAWQDTDVPVSIVVCAFKDDAEIIAALAPFRDRICGVQCRGDKYVQYVRRIIPFLPPEVLVSTPESLLAATHKYLMRRNFLQHFPEITPQCVRVQSASAASIADIEQRLGYPVIVKPANLASSILIQSCHTKAELQYVLQKVFQEIHRMYQAEGRDDEPQVIVEEYLEGDFYSIDAYVLQPGDVYVCPPVAYIPAKQRGVNDFSLYKRFVPIKLSAAEINAANEVVAKAIQAVGLRYSTVHVELVLTKKGWRVIELGPRMGAYRRTMYAQAYNIDHSFNDVMIHLGKKPRIPTKRLRYCAAYTIYPKKEGILREITGIKQLQASNQLVFFRINKRPGEHCLHAKNGGRAIMECIVASPDKKAHDTMIDFIEREVDAVID